MNDWVVETSTFEEDLMNNRVVMLNRVGVDRVVEIIKEKDQEIERLNKELEIAKDNEETYRLEMLDITKRLGLKEDTIFDEVKDKAERLNNIIKEVREYIRNNSKEGLIKDKKYFFSPEQANDILEILEKGE